MNAPAILHLNLHRQYFGEIVAKTKRTILEIYDALAKSMQTGKAYQTRLNPPPADARCCHPPRNAKEP